MPSAHPIISRNSFDTLITPFSRGWFYIPFTILYFYCFIFFSTQSAQAACSSYKNRAVINEAHRQGNTERFVEIKLLDASITDTIYDNWSITICSNARGCTGAISVSAANDSGYPHVVIEMPQIPHQNYIDLTVGGGMDVILRDGSGNTIDYFSVSGYTNQQDTTCTPAYDWDFPGSNSQTVLRSPDGTGDWQMAGPGGSVPPTEYSPNDTLPDGSAPPRLDITDVTVTSGNTAVFTLTLLDPVSIDPVDDYTVSLDYQTIDDTALAGADYAATSGTITFPEGSPAGSTATVSVDTITGCASGSDLYFYLFLNNQVNVTLLNHFAIGTIQLTGSSSLDHFEIEHDGSALTCEPETVTVKACQTVDCSTLYPCSTDITLSPSGWVGGVNKTFSGSATFQLRHTTLAAPPAPDIVTLGISAYTPIPSSATPVTCLNTTTSAANCDIAFYESGFVFDIPTQVACEASAAVTISAVRKDLATEQCVPAFANRTETIDFQATYANPATGTNSLTLNTVSPPNVYNLTPPAVTPITLDFNASGESVITVNYPDAGQLQLDASFTGSGSEAGLVMTGTDTFVTRPAGLCVYADDVNADCASGDGTCTAFKIADEPFTLKIKGVCWQAAGESDTDFCDNAITPNFQLNNIAVTQNLVGPAGGLTGTIGVNAFNMTAGDSGEHVIINQSISEVGVFSFTADPPDYLGAGDIIPTSTSANIGRFYPKQFTTSVTNGIMNNGCGAFTYSGQPFSYATAPTINITPENFNDLPVSNYNGTFQKLDVSGIFLSYPTSDAIQLGADTATLVSLTNVPGAAVLTPITPPGTNLVYAFGADLFTYTHESNSIIANFISDIRISLTAVAESPPPAGDGIAAIDLPRTIIPAGTEIRFGRLDLLNSFGPETENILMPLYIEYFDGTNFVLNTLDICTTLTDLPAGPPQWGDILLPALSYTDNLDQGETAPSLSALGGGSATITFTAPGEGNEGNVGITIDLSPAGVNIPWLQYDWDNSDNLNDGPYDDNPSATASFGLFRGNDRIINWQEIMR